MDDKIITLRQIAESVNNVNIGGEIVTFDDMAVLRDIESRTADSGVPLRFDALMLILVRRGSGVIDLDMDSYSVGPDTLIVLHPQHFVSYRIGEGELRADILACSRRVVEGVMPRFSDILPVLIATHRNPVVHLTREQAASLHSTYHFVREKMQAPSGPFMQRMMTCMLQGALFEIMQMIDSRSGETRSEASSRPEPGRRSEEILGRFIYEVTEHFRTRREVSDYAQRMNITPKHLSAVVKEKTGLTAGKWISNYICMEARMLLRTTDLTVQEIAAQLGFCNQSAFGKYFKNQCGVSPLKYREEGD